MRLTQKIGLRQYDAIPGTTQVLGTMELFSFWAGWRGINSSENTWKSFDIVSVPHFLGVHNRKSSIKKLLELNVFRGFENVT